MINKYHLSFTKPILVQPDFEYFHSRDPSILMQSFCVYVRPLLEFSSQVCSPHHKYLIDKVESVQRFFTKRLSGLRGLSYCERLNILGFQTLECWHFINDLTLCYNILHGLCDTSLSVNLSNSVTRGNCLKLVAVVTVGSISLLAGLLMFGIA